MSRMTALGFAPAKDAVGPPNVDWGGGSGSCSTLPSSDVAPDPQALSSPAARTTRRNAAARVTWLGRRDIRRDGSGRLACPAVPDAADRADRLRARFYPESR